MPSQSNPDSTITHAPIRDLLENMVILNAWAFVVLPSIFVFMWYIHLYFPGIVENPHGNFVTCVFALIISGIYEMIGVKGRVFFIPIWLLSVIGICASGFQLWGIMFAIYAVIALVLIFWLLHVSLKRMENKQLAMLPEKWKQFSVKTSALNSLEYWKEAKTTLFFPIFHPYTLEVIQHNRRVIDAIMTRMGASLAEEERQIVSNYQNFLRLLAGQTSPPENKQNIAHDELQKFIDQKIKTLSSINQSQKNL